MSEFKISSKEFLKGVLVPHTELAVDLMNMVKSRATNDPTHRFQIASIIIFLAGIDKTLSLAFGLLYLAGKVDWNWMVPNAQSKPPAGVIECQRGLTAKIMKLKELGVDLTHLQWLIDLRNEYVHNSVIHVGYTIGLDEVDKIRLNASGPVISCLEPPIVAIQPEEIRHYAQQLIDEVGSFVDKMGWQSEWFRLGQKIEQLPKNPEPEYTQIVSGQQRALEVVETLNKRFVGDGAKLLREYVESATRAST